MNTQPTPTPTPQGTPATELEKFAWQVLTGSLQENEYKYQWAARQIEKRIEIALEPLRSELSTAQARASAAETALAEMTANRDNLNEAWKLSNQQLATECRRLS